MVPILEALYRLDLPPEEWARTVAEALVPLIDRDRLGVLGAFYECRDPSSLTLERPVRHGVSDDLLEVSAQPRKSGASVMARVTP